MPQGGPISLILLNILLNQFDKEMEKRGRLFVRYADDVDLFVRSEKAAAIPLVVTYTKHNQVIKGWINYFKIGSMRLFLKQFGAWLQHKVRVVIFKQWKKAPTIIRDLTKLNKAFNNGFNEGSIYKVANSGYGHYRRASLNVCIFILSPTVLETPNSKENRPGLINPYAYYSFSVFNHYSLDI